MLIYYHYDYSGYKHPASKGEFFSYVS